MVLPVYVLLLGKKIIILLLIINELLKINMSSQLCVAPATVRALDVLNALVLETTDLVSLATLDAEVTVRTYPIVAQG